MRYRTAHLTLRVKPPRAPIVPRPAPGSAPAHAPLSARSR
jgi:hypothetical protein